MNVEERKAQIEAMKAELATARKELREEANKNSYVGIKRRINQAFLTVKGQEGVSTEDKTADFVASLKEIVANL